MCCEVFLFQDENAYCVITRKSYKRYFFLFTVAQAVEHASFVGTIAARTTLDNTIIRRQSHCCWSLQNHTATARPETYTILFNRADYLCLFVIETDGRWLPVVM